MTLEARSRKVVVSSSTVRHQALGKAVDEGIIT